MEKNKQHKRSNSHDLMCPKCGGSHSLSIYWEDSDRPKSYCHKCEDVILDLDILEELEALGGSKHRITSPSSSSSSGKRGTTTMTTSTKDATKTPFKLFRGIITDIPERKIRQETCEKYGVEKLFIKQKPAGYSFPRFNEGKVFVSQKIKPIGGKDSGGEGINNMHIRSLPDVQPSKECLMFGQQAFQKGGRYITITEGEEDALACYQMLKDYGKNTFEPVVISVNDGAGKSAVRDCKRQWEFINSFDTIILAFDGDKIGQETAKLVGSLFPFKVKIMRFPDAVKDKTTNKWEWKDSCDYLRNNKIKEFVRMWYDAERFVPKGVRTFKSLWRDMIRKDLNISVPFPWEGLEKMCEGMLTGKMDVYKAHPKQGKTTLLAELIMHIQNTTQHNVGVIFLENTAKEIGLKLTGINMGLPLDRNKYQELINKDKEFFERVNEEHEKISKKEQLLILDPEDERTVENILNKILYFVKACDCKFLFLDHATMLAYTAENTDERRFLDKLFADLKQLTTSLNIYLGVVIHVNDDGKTRGSRAPIQLCDRLYSLERDKTNPCPVISNTTDFIVEENRYGQSGLACRLFYDNDTGRMTEIDEGFGLGEQEDATEKETRNVMFYDGITD